MTIDKTGAPPAKQSRLKEFLFKRIHILQWLPRYTKNDVISDFIAGITVGLTMIPQSLAYAGLAGVSPEYGLYTAFIGSFTYIFFGTIREVSIGPTSLMCLLTFSFTKNLPIECITLLTFVAGCVELLMGILKLGFLVDFISPCLTSGFTSASAIIIIVAQLKGLLGIRLKSHDTFEVLKELSHRYGETRLYDTLLGCSCMAFLLIFKHITKIPTSNPKIKKTLWFLSISKNAIIVLITSFLGFFLAENGGAPFKLTGHVPQGMPDMGFPPLSVKIGNETMGYMEMVQSMGAGVIVIPVVAILANVAIAKAYSADVVVDATQEMMTLGLCNILGSFVKALPSCGAFTRSSVARSSDVRTPLQGIYSGSVIILALSFLAQYFYFIPKSTLSAVLIVAASSLVDYGIFPVLWRCNKLDFFLTLGTFVIGTFMGVETALVIGAAFNLIALLKIWTRPKVTTEIRKNKEQDYLYVKPELGLLYPGADYVSETIKKQYNDNGKLSIVMDCINIMKLDYSAAKVLENLIYNYNNDSTQFVLINFHPKALNTLKTITDTPLLDEVCTQSDDLKEICFGNNFIQDEEAPLINRRRSSQVRKLSMISTEGEGNRERKLSVYSLE